MKTLLILSALLIIAFSANSQSLEYTRQINRSVFTPKSESQVLVLFPVLAQSMWYPPRKVQGLHMISVNRPNSGMDDVYFIDKKGNTHYHTIKPTAPVNLYMDRMQQRRYDSFNPHGSTNMGEALSSGVSAILSGLMFR